MIGTQQVLLDDCSFFHHTLAQGCYIAVTMFQNLHHKLQNMNYLMTNCRSYHQLWQRKRCVEPGIRHGNILLVYRPPFRYSQFPIFCTLINIVRIEFSLIQLHSQKRHRRAASCEFSRPAASCQQVVDVINLQQAC